MFKTTNRRKFLKTSVAAGLALSAPMIANADGHGKPRLVIIGGGVGGATVARYVAKQTKGAIDVILIEMDKRYTTCFFTNWYLADFRTFESITHEYLTLESDYGIKVIHQYAAGIDSSKKMVLLQDGSMVAYDKCVTAPGIDFIWDSVPGHAAEMTVAMPHAYKGGEQTKILKNQLNAMADGGVFVMIAPPNPYRCPPGPYERISMVANYFKKNKPRSKIMILDPKEKFSKQALFQESWANYYDGMVEWLPASITGDIQNVNGASKIITLEDEEIKADVINIIPKQKAGNIAQLAGLTDDSGWCPIKDATTFESANISDVHVLGDASINGAMPKSGFSANSQAKIVANAIAHQLIDAKQFPARFRNTCWSLVSDNDGVKVGASYKAEGAKVAKIDGFISATGESDEIREQTKNEAIAWYDSITADTFG